MLVILPIAAYVLLLYVFRSKNFEWRGGILAAATLWGVYVTATAEILSVQHRLTQSALSLAWLGLCLAIVVFANLPSQRLRPTAATIQARTSPAGFSTRDKASLNLLAGVGLVIFLVGVTAFFCPPNTWDAMDYHMPRVVQWINNRGVQFYPAHDYSQLIFAPWAEYAMLDLDLLFGGDRFVNFVEWLSLIGSAIGVSAITKLLGGNRWAQVLAAVFSATISEGVLEASGAMNTYVEAFWLVASVYFLLRWREEQSWFNVIASGASIGLATLTKGTAYVYLPCIVFACWWLGSRRAKVLFLQRLPVVILFILGLNAPQFIRNYDLTGSPLGLPFPDGGPRLKWKNDRLSVSGTFSNVIRNAALHLGTSNALNAKVQGGIERLIRVTGADPHDRANTWVDTQWSKGFHLNTFSRHEILAGNPLHFFVILLVGVLLLGHLALRCPPAVIPYTLGIGGAYLLFCALLRWQMWGSRHHTPLFVLMSVTVGIVLSLNCSRQIATWIGALLILSAIALALGNSIRPLVPWPWGWSPSPSILTRSRAELYLEDQHRYLATSFISAAARLKAEGCRNVGIDSVPGTNQYYVYPMLTLLDAGFETKVFYSDVQNLSRKYMRQEEERGVCAVVCLNCANVRQKWEQYRSIGGQASVSGNVVVFSAHGQIVNSPTNGYDAPHL